MTPEERAEKIAMQVAALAMTASSSTPIKELIAAQIREAVDEATQDALKVRDHDVKIVKESVDRAIAEAYEDAAKIADDHTDPLGSKPYVKAAQDIAEAIRARAKEVSP